MSDKKPVGKREKNRQNNRKLMFDAFEHVLKRDGVHNLRTNEIMAEAGLAKPTLYSYFGGLDGLLRAWVRDNPLLPPEIDLVDAKSQQELHEMPAKERARQGLLGIGDHLHNHEAITRLFADDLSGPTPFTDILQEMRDKKQREMMDSLSIGAANVLSRENYRLIIVLYAAVLYGSMRSLSKRDFLGMSLHTEEGWDDYMSAVSEIIDDLILAAEIKEVVNNP